MLSDVEERLELLEAELAIRRLVAVYCHGADKRDLDRFLSVWASNASWVLSDEATFRGHDAIASVVRRQWEAFAGYVHWTSNHVVEVDGDRAKGECDVAVAVQLHNGQWLHSGGTYIDEYVRSDGRWLIARRDARRGFDIDPPPEPHDIPVRFDDLLSSTDEEN